MSAAQFQPLSRCHSDSRHVHWLESKPNVGMICCATVLGCAWAHARVEDVGGGVLVGDAEADGVVVDVVVVEVAFGVEDDEDDELADGRGGEVVEVVVDGVFDVDGVAREAGVGLGFAWAAARSAASRAARCAAASAAACAAAAAASPSSRCCWVSSEVC